MGWCGRSPGSAPKSSARALFGLTNVLVMFGGSKDGGFNQEIPKMLGQITGVLRLDRLGDAAVRGHPVRRAVRRLPRLGSARA
jgi:hypothetical protein